MLRKAKFAFEREPVIGRARPDFIVTTPEGAVVVVEAKAWDSTPENAGRALHQVKRYMELTGASAAVVVTPKGEVLSAGSGTVAPLSRLSAVLSSLSERLATTTRLQPSPKSRRPPKNHVFASMPFAAKYDDTFLVAIEPAALASGAVAERVDHSGSTGDVVAQIQSMIRTAKVVVADLSDSRPNVLHEVGFAEALNKPVVQICSTATTDLPFNVRNNQTIRYTIGQTAKLRKRLEQELQEVI